MSKQRLCTQRRRQQRQRKIKGGFSFSFRNPFTRKNKYVSEKSMNEYKSHFDTATKYIDELADYFDDNERGFGQAFPYNEFTNDTIKMLQTGCREAIKELKAGLSKVYISEEQLKNEKASENELTDISNSFKGGFSLKNLFSKKQTHVTHASTQKYVDSFQEAGKEIIAVADDMGQQIETFDISTNYNAITSSFLNKIQNSTQKAIKHLKQGLQNVFVTEKEAEQEKKQDGGEKRRRRRRN